MDIDDEVGEEVIGAARLAGRTDVFHHEGFDGGGSFDRAEAADPFAVFGEELAVGFEVVRVEEAAVVCHERADFFDIVEALDALGERGLRVGGGGDCEGG